jgi:hypothetical protein
VPLAGSFSVGLFPNRACKFPRTLISGDHFGYGPVALQQTLTVADGFVAGQREAANMFARLIREAGGHDKCHRPRSVRITSV